MAIVTAMFCSCELETSDNGDLDGMWRLASIDTLATSGSKDMNGTKLYWSFQMHLLQFSDKTGENSNVLLRFEHSDGILRVYNPYIEDEPVNDASLLAPFGMNKLEEEFTVESLSSSKMTLKSETLRLKFRKL